MFGVAAIFAVGGTLMGSRATAGAPRSTVTLANQVVVGLAADRDLGAVRPDQSVEVVVTLQKDLASLYKAEAALYNPASPSYHHFFTPTRWNAAYGVPAQQLAGVRSFVTSRGMKLGNPDVLHDYVLATGTAAQAEQTFGVSLHKFRDASGNTFFANTSGPTVPAGLGIDAVLGLESKHRLHTHQSGHQVATAGQPQCVPDPQSPTGNICTGLLEAQDLWSVYNQPSNNFGEGQTMGIIGEGQTADVIAALREFETTRHLPSVPVQVYHVDPSDGPNVAESARDDSGRGEWELDTQASTGMAPHVQQIRLYFGTSLQLTQLSLSLQTWANDPSGPLQASASLGACEDTPTTDILFGASQRASMTATLQAAMEGRTLFASTGDTGAGCAIQVAVNGVTYGPVPLDEYPSVDPNAVGVGGTIVYTDGATPPHRVSERGWDHTGGGPSRFQAQPAYQTGVGGAANPTPLTANACISHMDGTPYPAGQLCRGVSDVAALSGDATVILDHRLPHGTVSANGYDMVDCSGFDSNHVCTSYNDNFSEGGTSLSSPLWLGMWTRVQAHHDAGNSSASSLGFANNVIYPLAKDCTTGPRDFFDIAVMNAPGNPYQAVPRVPCVGGTTTSDGWDYPTGWGAPDVTNLTKDSSGNTTTAPASTTEPCGPPTCPDPAPIFTAPAKSIPPPACAFALFDPNADAPDTAGGQDAQLDVTELDLGLTADGKSLRAVFTILNLNTVVPTPWTIIDYQAYWSLGSTVYAVDAEVDKLGNVTYTDGTFQVVQNSTVGNQYQFVPNPTSTATGTFGSGPSGKIEVDAPLSEIGSPSIGSVLSQPFAVTAESAGKGVASQGFIIDLDGPGNDYKLGQATCISAPSPGVPEAPLAALLVAAGIGGTLGTVWFRRRRSRN